MTKKNSGWFVWAVIVFGCIVAPVFADAQKLDPKKPYALIAGTVYGPDDRPLAAVKIKIRRGNEKKARWELISDRRGEFAQRFPAGAEDYYIWAEAKGFKAAQNKELKVHIDNEERQDISLHLIK